jgi:hypothetical protein
VESTAKDVSTLASGAALFSISLGHEQVAACAFTM